MPVDAMQWAILGAVGLLSLPLLVCVGPSLWLYLRAWLAGVRVPMIELLGMHLRRCDARAVIDARIRAARSGIRIETSRLETHDLAGGDVGRVVSAVIAAKEAGVRAPWNTVAANDLAGVDLFEGIGRPPSSGQERPAAPARAEGARARRPE